MADAPNLLQIPAACRRRQVMSKWRNRFANCDPDRCWQALSV